MAGESAARPDPDMTLFTGLTGLETPEELWQQARARVAYLDANRLPDSKTVEDNVRVALQAAQLDAKWKAQQEESRRKVAALEEHNRRRAAGPKIDLSTVQAVEMNQHRMVSRAAADAGASVQDKPPTFWAVVQPAQAPPDPPIEDLAPVQRLMETYQQLQAATTAPTTPAAAYRALLVQPGGLPTCPDEATARAVFASATTCQDAELAAGAFQTFMGWCGVPGLAAGDDVLQLDCVLPYTPTPAPSLTWVPGAEDFLCALQSLGCTTTPSSSSSSSRDAGGGGTTGSTTAAAPRSSRQQQGRSKHTAATATTSSSSSSAAAADTCYRDAPLRQALVLCAHVLRLGAAGQLEVPLPEAAAKQLGLLLLSLQLDARVRLGALGPAQEALAALAEALPEVSWSRVAPELASAIAAPLGPSHRGAVVVLQQLPTSSSPRLAALRQAAALQLMYLLCKHPQGAKGSSRQHAQGASLSDLQQLLEAPAKGAGLAAAGSKGRGGKQGGDSRVRQLLGLVTARGEGAPDFWALLSLLDAADALLLCHAEAGGGALEPRMGAWWVAYLQDLENGIKRWTVAGQHVKARISELMTLYQPPAAEDVMGDDADS